MGAHNPQEHDGEKQKRAVRLQRDTVIFLVGLAGIVHETLIALEERPFLLALFAAMIGLTGVLRAEEGVRRRRNGNGNR